MSSASVDVHCYRQRDAAGGGTVGLQTLEFMEDLVEAPLYGALLMDREAAGNLLVVADPPYPHRDIVSIRGQQTTDK